MCIYMKLFNNRLLFPVFILLFLIPFHFLLYKIYIPRIAAFGCADDCFNYVAAFFMLKGKNLYSDIFFNHQLIMPYISYVIQFFLHPQSIYELLLRHRQFLLIFGFFMDFLIILRFRFAGIIFVLFYELSKFYLFGNRFLAECFVVYPISYMTGTVWYKFKSLKIYYFDYILAAFFAWFVIFSREPYSLVALFSFGFLLFDKKSLRIKIISILIFLFLTITILSTVSIKDYIYNVVYTNNQVFLTPEARGHNLLGVGSLKAFFYYLYLLTNNGVWNFFRYFMIIIDVCFISSLTYLLLFKRQIKSVIAILFLMGLANLRIVEPGVIFYGAFYLLPWYGIFLLISALFAKDIFDKNHKFGFIIFFLFFIAIIYFVFSPNSYLHEKPNPQYDLITNYGKELQVGSVVNVLSDKNDTLFLDGGDDLIYYQADRLSSYKYTWYTSIMPYFKQYTDARINMFRKNPPDFYYAFCSKNPPADRALPEFLKNKYQGFTTTGNPTCLYIRKDKINKIPKYKWQKAKDWLFELKKDT